MEKLKFNIEGMHCKACATLIQDRLSGPGIISAKINPDSKKGIVMYNPQKIKKSEIFQKIEEAGDYTPQETTEDEQKKEVDDKPDGETNLLTIKKDPTNAQRSKTMFFIGLLTAISFVSIIFNILLGSVVLKQGNTGEKFDSNTQGAAVLNDQPNPSLPDQAQQIAAKQDFQITKKDHIRGNYNAPVTLVEFSDFECPFCVRHYPTLKKILSDYPEQVRVVYKHFPLSNIHQNAQKAAEASECADEQGKFWEYHDKMFENSTGYTLDKFKQWAADLGLNSEKFNTCLDSGKYAQKVNDDYQEGAGKGVQGTPATFVNGQLVSGALPYENFKQIIDSLL